MMANWRVLTPDETSANRVAFDRAAVAEAWELWRQYLCEESHGGHPWVLEVDAGTAQLVCEHGCGAECYPDHADLLYARIPVTVTVDHGETWTDCGLEYDLWITAEPDADRWPT